MLTNEERIALIRERINAKLSPTTLEVIDESQHHIGHAGAATGAGHFSVRVASAAFVDQGLVACHRMIYDAVGDAMGGEIHALRIEILRD